MKISNYFDAEEGLFDRVHEFGIWNESILIAIVFFENRIQHVGNFFVTQHPNKIIEMCVREALGRRQHSLTQYT